ncbi:hypothetical protein B0E48_16200 [Rhodanobacter sp. C03]|nr:hypothetical protein B0E48_16200 [Rhodanobacter sp. C03]
MSDFSQTYFSKDLFPLFANRALPKNRPEYADYIEWLGLSKFQDNQLDELARTGGLRATDNLELIPCPEPTKESMYEAFFFVRGLRHATPASRERADELKAGERLFLICDLQNMQDRAALMLRTDDPISLIGYTPAYFARDFMSLLKEGEGSKKVEVTVEKVNLDAPAQYRILCKILAPWPSHFSPCEDQLFKEFS